MDEKRNSLYIRVNKGLCTQAESKFPDQPYYNIMKLPRGTVVDGTDLSFAAINPRVMIEDRRNPRMFCAVYDLDKLKGRSISVFMRDANGVAKRMEVDAEKLRDAVAAANHSYYEEQKAKHSHERTQDVVAEESAVHEKKIEPLTTEALNDEELDA